MASGIPALYSYEVSVHGGFRKLIFTRLMSEFPKGQRNDPHALTHCNAPLAGLQEDHVSGTSIKACCISTTSLQRNLQPGLVCNELQQSYGFHMSCARRETAAAVHHFQERPCNAATIFLGSV